MEKENIKYVLTQFADRGLPPLKPRALRLPLDSRKVTTLVGIRRTGKTWLLYETMQRLEASGVSRKQMIYLNFEDDRLFPIEPEELDLILRAHEELYPDVSGKTRYLFFDEVQNAPGWERFVRRLQDTEDVIIFVTGSSSHLLSQELATGLRGRSISYEVFPLSFAEFLVFQGLEYQPYSRSSESHIVAALDEYLQTGGMPEIVLAAADLRPRILKEYIDLIFYKDLIERYRVKNTVVLRMLLKRCLGRPASLINIHKLYHDFRSQGHSLSKDTLYQYVGYLEDAFVIFTLPVAERSIRKQQANPKKVHSVDWALAYPYAPMPQIDVGWKLENAVFLHWRRKREDLAYVYGDREIDLAVGLDGPGTLVNVAYSALTSEAWERELNGLEWGRKRWPQALCECVIHQTPPARQAPVGIRVVEAWRYLLDLENDSE